MNTQEFNKRICGFKSRHDLFYFLMYTLLQLKYIKQLYCYCHLNQRKGQICLITTECL